MSDDPWSLFDALCDLSMEWAAVRESYSKNRLSSLRLCLDPVGLSAGTYYGELANALRWTAAIEQITKCMDALDVEIARAEEERVQVLYRLSKLSTGPAAQSDGGASTSTRAPGAAGPRTQPESGQGNHPETDF
jgi:hypothetical protein